MRLQVYIVRHLGHSSRQHFAEVEVQNGVHNMAGKWALFGKEQQLCHKLCKIFSLVHDFFSPFVIRKYRVKMIWETHIERVLDAVVQENRVQIIVCFLQQKEVELSD